MPGRVLPGRVFGNSAGCNWVWKNRCPQLGSGQPLSRCVRGSGRPESMSCFEAELISSSRKRLTWRELRATSDVPFLARSSSSKTTIGIKMSCSANRNSAAGSCINTLVSRTKSFLLLRDLMPMRPEVRSMVESLFVEGLDRIKVLRSIPRTCFPYMFFSLMTSKASHKTSSLSATKSNGKPCFALKFSCALRLSREAPRMTQDWRRNFAIAAPKSSPSWVQPGVLAFG